MIKLVLGFKKSDKVPFVKDLKNSADVDRALQATAWDYHQYLQGIFGENNLPAELKLDSLHEQ
ncbi:MAG: hypothetical protein GOV15_04595 [Candidatus Diapherotrites archaeon]|nr:hypothetical protein [Candidatus Diapherotrites archaeon]